MWLALQAASRFRSELDASTNCLPASKLSGTEVHAATGGRRSLIAGLAETTRSSASAAGARQHESWARSRLSKREMVDMTILGNVTLP
jgi:hypothetical protein